MPRYRFLSTAYTTSSGDPVGFMPAVVAEEQSAASFRAALLLAVVAARPRGARSSLTSLRAVGLLPGLSFAGDENNVIARDLINWALCNFCFVLIVCSRTTSQT